MRVALLNPNTDVAVTEVMRAIAQRAAPPDWEVVGFTAPFGAALITDAGSLARAAEAVLASANRLAGYGGVIVAAFGDPGLEALRARLPCPVVGIAEAAMRAAGADGRRFAVATTTPGLTAAIAARAASYPGFLGTWLTPGDPVAIMSDPAGLVDALHAACRAAVDQGGAQAVVIGGGPLALAAEALRDRLSVPVIAPIPEAVRLLRPSLQETP